MRRIFLTALAPAVLSGCALLFTPPKEQPVTKEIIGGVFGDKETNVFSLTPERRTVIVQSAKNEPPKFCAEPPPDVAENIASSVRALVEATAKAPADTSAARANAELARSLNTTSSSIFYRSQGVQIFRDGLYNLCQSNMNGIINREDFLALYKELLHTSYLLTSLEIPTVQTVRNQELAIQSNNAKTLAEAAQQAASQAEEAAKKHSEQAKQTLDAINSLKK